MTDDEILKKLGAKLKEIRLEANMKQRELSERSGLSMFSISQIETGHNTSILSLIQILKVLNRMDLFEPFLKDREIDPKLIEEFIKRQQPTRQRVTSPRPYFNEEDQDDDSQLRMVADDSELA